MIGQQQVLLIDKLESEPSYWCAYVPFLQDIPEVFDAFLNTIDVALAVTDSEKADYRLNSVAKYLSTERIKELVGKKHDLLIKSPQAWLALWCSDVPEALKLVQEALIQSDPKDWYFFFFHNDSFRDSISLRMLDFLLPVLQKYQSTRERIAEMAAKKGFGDWIYEHLPDLIVNPEIRYYFPMEEDINDALTDIIESHYNHNKLYPFSKEIHPIQSVFHQRCKFNSLFDVREILKAWISKDITLDRLNLIAKLLTFWGNSEDIDWWRELQPKEQPAYAIWDNTLNILKRRRWHSMDEYIALS